MVSNVQYEFPISLDHSKVDRHVAAAGPVILYPFAQMTMQLDANFKPLSQVKVPFPTCASGHSSSGLGNEHTEQEMSAKLV
jgi:hypothetical protein